MKKGKISFCVYLTTFIGLFLISARAVILPIVLKELNAPQYYNLAVILNSSAMCMVIPAAGKLSDIYGRKRVYIIGAAGYSIACMICLFSSNVLFFLIGLSLTGVFFGLMNSVQLAVIIFLYTKEEQMKKVSNINIANSVASISAPIISGFFADYLSWRLVFLAVVPASLYILYVLSRYMKDDSVKREERPRINNMGFLWFTLTLVPVITLVSGGRSGIYWYRTLPAILLVLAIIAGCKLVKEEREAVEPILPYRLLRYNTFTFSIIVYLFCSIGFAGMNYLPVYYQQVRGVSAFMCGCFILPRQIAQICLSIGLKRHIARIKNIVNTILIFLLLYVLTFFVMSNYTDSTTIWLVLCTEIFYGISNSAVTILSQSYCSEEIPAKDVGSGTAFIGFTGALGMTVGAAVGGFILDMHTSLIYRLNYVFLTLGICMIMGVIYCIIYISSIRRNKKGGVYDAFDTKGD